VHSHASAGSLFSRLLTLWFPLVPKIKIEFQGLSFGAPDGVQKAVTDAIKTLPETD
jgi:hypothetical protein